jgi:hypothetical protein
MSETTVVDSRLDESEQDNRRVEADAPTSNLEAPYVVGMPRQASEPPCVGPSPATSFALATTRSQARQ